MQSNVKVRTFFETAAERMQAVLSPALPNGVIVAFELSGKGGGRWTLSKHDDLVQVVPRESAVFDCRLSCSAADFDALLAGTFDTRQGFLDGRLVVEGDVGLVRRLSKAFRGVGLTEGVAG